MLTVGIWILAALVLGRVANEDKRLECNDEDLYPLFNSISATDRLDEPAIFDMTFAWNLAREAARSFSDKLVCLEEEDARGRFSNSGSDNAKSSESESSWGGVALYLCFEGGGVVLCFCFTMEKEFKIVIEKKVSV